MGELEAALLLGARVGERPRLVAEELRLDEALRQGPAAHLHEGLLGPGRAVVQGVGHELLARARLPAHEHGGARLRHLRDLLVDLLHRPGAAHDVADVVALAQLLAELRVLVEEALPFRLHEVVDAHGLADHRAHDPEELRLLLVAPVLVVGQRHPERPHRVLVRLDGHADERQLVLPRLLEDAAAVEEERLAAHPRHHDGPAALDDASRDPFPDPVPGVGAELARSRGRLHREVAAPLVLEGDGGGQRAVAFLQDLEDAQERGPEVQGGAEGLADLEEVGERAGVGSGGSGHLGGKCEL